MSENNIFSFIKATKETYDENTAIRDEIKEKMFKEIREKDKEIEEKYQKDFDVIDAYRSKLEDSLNHYNKLLNSYSSFDIDDIGNIMALVMTQMEGEEYIFQRAKHDTFNWHEFYVFSDDYDRCKHKICIIIKKKLSRDIYRDLKRNNSCILNLEQEKKAICLDESVFDHIDTYEITFYNKGELNKNVDLSRFPYTKDFIDYLVQYRYENNLIDDLDFDKLEYLANEFINSKKEKVYVKK